MKVLLHLALCSVLYTIMFGRVDGQPKEQKIYINGEVFQNHLPTSYADHCSKPAEQKCTDFKNQLCETVNAVFTPIITPTQPKCAYAETDGNNVVTEVSFSSETDYTTPAFVDRFKTAVLSSYTNAGMKPHYGINVVVSATQKPPATNPEAPTKIFPDAIQITGKVKLDNSFVKYEDVCDKTSTQITCADFKEKLCSKTKEILNSIEGYNGVTTECKVQGGVGENTTTTYNWLYFFLNGKILDYKETTVQKAVEEAVSKTQSGVPSGTPYYDGKVTVGLTQPPTKPNSGYKTSTHATDIIALSVTGMLILNRI